MWCDVANEQYVKLQLSVPSGVSKMNMEFFNKALETVLYMELITTFCWIYKQDFPLSAKLTANLTLAPAVKWM